MDRPAFHILGIGLVIDCLAQQVENTTQALIADRYRNRTAGVDSFHAAYHTIGRVHADAAGNIVTHVLRHFSNDLPIAVADLYSVEQLRQLTVLEADVEYGADDLNHLAHVLFRHVSVLLSRRLLFSAGHDLGDLLSDRALACTVIAQCQFADHCFCVL